MVSKVGPIYLEATVIVHVDELVGNGAFHMLLAKEVTSAQRNRSRIRRESPSLGQVTRCAEDIGRRNFAARTLQMLEHEDNNRACLQSRHEL